jgi:hypothetical protein
LQEGLVEFGKITDEGIALLRERIGVERKKSPCLFRDRDQLLFRVQYNLS